MARTTITDPDGTERKILRDNMPFGTVGTGTLFFVPSADFLDDLPDPPGGTVAQAGPAPDVQRPPDDSLGIGNLRGNTDR